MDKALIEQRVKDCLIKGNRKFNAKAKISKIIYMGNATKDTGKAVKDADGVMYIKLSRHYLDREFDWMMEEIIPHEVAHIIGFWLEDNGGQGTYYHDDRWREIAIFLGSSGEDRPRTPETYEHKSKYHYKTSTGRDLFLDQDKHDALQNQFRVFKDTRDGGTITAAHYAGK